jgi:hypothetical protein
MSAEYYNVLKKCIPSEDSDNLRYMLDNLFVYKAYYSKYATLQSIREGLQIAEPIDYELVITILVQIDIIHYQYTHGVMFNFLSQHRITREIAIPCIEYLEDVIVRITEMPYNSILVGNIEYILVSIINPKHDLTDVSIYALNGFAAICLEKITQTNVTIFLARFELYYKSLKNDNKKRVINILADCLKINFDIVNYIMSIHINIQMTYIIIEAIRSIPDGESKFIELMKQKIANSTIYTKNIWTVDCVYNYFRKVAIHFPIIDLNTAKNICNIFIKCCTLIKNNMVFEGTTMSDIAYTTLMYEILATTEYKTIKTLSTLISDTATNSFLQSCLLHYDRYMMV